MVIQDLKDFIITNELIPTILESLGCHHIKRHENYYSCANCGGDNLNAVNVFSSSLSVINYTRDLDTVSKYHDIFTLVQFYKSCNFFDAVKYVCSTLGLSTYHNFDDDIPESIVLTRMLAGMLDDDTIAEPDKPLKPIQEEVLSYYTPCVNDMFLKDNISYATPLAAKYPRRSFIYL